MRSLRDARPSPNQRGRAGRTGERDDDSFARLPRCGDAVALAVVLQAVVDLVGQPQQGELSKGGQVARPEVVRERGIDLLRCVDVAVGHAPPQLLRRAVDELHLLGGPDDVVRDRLALLDAGDALDHVVERLEVLDVDGRDHVDPGVEQLVHVLPALLVPRARHVGVGQLVDEGDGGVAGEDGVDVHLLELGLAVLHGPARNDLEIAELLLGARAAVRLDVAHDDVGAAVVTALPSLSIANVLPTPGAAPR